MATTSLATSVDIDMGSDNAVQNGADAVAVYQADETDFPNDTPITLTNLIDVVVYGTGDGDDSGLLTGFNVTTQYDENANGNKDTESIQRHTDGTYQILAPSFRAENNTTDDPCDLVLGTIDAVCDAETMATDTYTATIAFTGGNTGITYTINSDAGTVGGDNPDTTESGTITITGISEETNIEVTIQGGAGSSCNYTRNIFSPTCFPTPTCPAVGSIIITEIMQNPSAVGDGDGEYFEVFNTTGSSIDLLGWILQDTSSASETHTITSSLIVPANGYVVLGVNSDNSTNGGVTVDYNYGLTYFLGNSSDDIVLECGGNTIDIVAWDNGATFPDPNGASMELATNKYNATDNDDGANWAVATSEITSGGDLGTPGAANDFVLGVSQNTIKGFNSYPNPVRGNNLTITTESSEMKEVQIYNVLGRRVFTERYSSNRKTLDISEISSGIYILKVIEGARIATQKIIKE